MALSRTNLIGSISGGGVGTGSYTTGAATTTSGEWLAVIGFANSGTAITGTDLTIADSKSNTYTSRMTLGASPSSNMAFRVWTAPVTSAGSTTWTIDAGAQSTDTYVVVVLSYAGATQTGVGVTGTNTSLGTDGAASITLSGTSAASSEVVALLGGDISTLSPTASPGASWTELYDTALANHAMFECQVRAAAVSSAPWADISDNIPAGVLAGSAGVAFEILAAGAAASFVTRPARISRALLRR